MIIRIMRYLYSWVKAIRYFPSTMHMLRLSVEQFEVLKQQYIEFSQQVDTLSQQVDEEHINVVDSIKDNTSIIIRNTQQIVNTAFLHRDVFKKYKNIHNNEREVVLVGTGPSVDKYKPIEDAVHIAVNRAIFIEKIKFDYLFAQHHTHKSNYNEEYEYLHNIDCRKYSSLKIFCGILCKDYKYHYEIIPESLALKLNAERFYTTQNRHNIFHGSYQIDSEEIYNTGKNIEGTGSISFVAFQFALYTNPKRIYLVGHDAAQTGYFNSITQPRTDWDKIIHGWKELKYFANIYYPDTEIISINPVGLVGVFHDKYVN